jgi:hypothetical protein
VVKQLAGAGSFAALHSFENVVDTNATQTDDELSAWERQNGVAEDAPL